MEKEYPQVGKNKLERWAELGTFQNVIQPPADDVAGKDHPVKGLWRKDIFGNTNPVVLELACGKGEYTIALSGLFPDRNYIGVDIKGARMWRGAKTAAETRSSNIAFLRTRIEFISSFFAENEVDEIWLIFPDPHPGKRNSNKRLTCPWFLNKYRTIMKDGGLVHLKTDNEELFNYTGKLARSNDLEILFETTDLYSVNESDRERFSSICSRGSGFSDSESIAGTIFGIKTHYESIFLNNGMKIFLLTFRMGKNKTINDGWKEGRLK